MSNVLGDKQRARTAKEKDRRRDSIVQSALELFLAKPGALPTMNAIATRAGVSKGTTYIYFDTKESIYLALLEDELYDWLQHIEKQLSYVGGDEVDKLVDALMAFTERQPNLWPLASLSHSVIELNIDSKELLSYKTKLAQRFKRCGKAIREHFKLSDKFSEEVEPMLMQSYAFILGQWQVCNPPSSIAKLLRGPGFKVLQPDFEKVTRHALEQLWRNFIDEQRKHEQGPGVLNRLFRRN
ncbi:hypothetical protein CWE12_06425 [Aliidiomarina sedimenti]|uniref:HTH tetR-type domain-containing protein n=1 Tax=Aliidiomarina sedimenti TaxID=1933879 RepID=A0ABY0C0B4_9GAMM|nr:TetR family transcriptional regulator [Aliidiomarina sedimenti]RUO30868.1 hypothetical protein CWE12_06425 [Aliidiomarina sedimenti]